MADIKLQQRQTLQLSAQQILSSQLLQLTMLNLEQRIYEELQENPLLEVVEERKDSAGDVVVESERSDGDDMFDAVERFSKSSLNERSDTPVSGEYGEGRVNFSQDSGSKERFFQAVQQDSFHDMLLKQLALYEEVGEREVMIAIEILGNLDSDGYFTEECDVIVDSLHLEGLDVSEGQVKGVLRKIMFLDPPGIAVRDLRERFLVQLQAGEGRYDLKIYRIATRILRDYFDDFLHRRFELLLKKLAEPKGSVEMAISAIVRLDPHPGIVQDEGGHYITPDFVVSYENGELTAVLNDRSSLSVKVTDRYQELLKNRKGPKEEKSLYGRTF